MRDGGDFAILCSGPTLQAFIEAPAKHDLYIGVNRAIRAHPCDWWVFSDHDVFNWHLPSNRPRACTSQRTWERINPRNYVSEFEFLYYDALPTSCSSHPGWKNYSLTIAMVLAEHLGAGRLTLYGVDQEGANDWDGPSPTRVTRNCYRWGNEKHKFGHVAAWLGRCGVELVHNRGAKHGEKTTG